MMLTRRDWRDMFEAETPVVVVPILVRSMRVVGPPPDLTERLNDLVEHLPVVRQLRQEVDQLREEIRILRAGDPDQLLDTHQAAELLGMTTGAVRAAAARGRLPAQRVGRRLRFRRGDLMSGARSARMLR